MPKFLTRKINRAAKAGSLVALPNSQEARLMRNPVHDTPVRFRANARLLLAAQAKADRQGMSLSELMRSALRREIGAC